MPYALWSQVEEALDKLEKEGIIEQVDFAEWAAPIIPVMKQKGTIRICGNYKVTIKQAAPEDSYPLAVFEDLFDSLWREDLYQAEHGIRLPAASSR